MPEWTHISPRMLMRDLVKRHPEAVATLCRHGIDPTYAYLSIELAAKASGRALEPLLADLRAALSPARGPMPPVA